MRLLLLCLAAPAFAQTIAILPPSVELAGPEARQQLIVEATAGEHQEDWTRAAECILIRDRWLFIPNELAAELRRPPPSWVVLMPPGPCP